MMVQKQFQLIKYLLVMGLITFLVWFSLTSPVTGAPLAQQPTGELPTVTSTPRGAYVVVDPIAATDTQINVRAGPSALTERVGVLTIYQQADAVGRYGDWIQIIFPGTPTGFAWVYGNLVTLFGGPLPNVEPPPTSTPNITNTVDPTLAAQFLITPDATRLPTFTEPAPLEIPTFEAGVDRVGVGGLPMGLLIIGLGALGVFLGVIALISGR